MNNEFLINLKNALNQLASLVSGRTSELNKTIDENIQAINIAYANIKEAKKETMEIAETVGAFARELEYVQEDILDLNDTANDVIDSCYELYNNGYIEDEELDAEDNEDDLSEEDDSEYLYDTDTDEDDGDETSENINTAC